ncbi:MAG: hypothetical protein LBE55_02710, partial [Clostridiales bacterium]|nr:hypothetical protein [Clostridiales bacterium]
FRYSNGSFHQNELPGWPNFFYDTYGNLVAQTFNADYGYGPWEYHFVSFSGGTLLLDLITSYHRNYWQEHNNEPFVAGVNNVTGIRFEFWDTESYHAYRISLPRTILGMPDNPLTQIHSLAALEAEITASILQRLMAD